MAWEDVPVYDPRSIIPNVFPGARITSTSRASTDPLSRKNPRSPHIDNPNAFDVAPIPGVTYENFLKKMNDAGYEVSGGIDEQKYPSKWATGPHWHGVITKGPTTSVEPQWEDVTTDWQDIDPETAQPIPVDTPAEVPVESTPDLVARLNAEQTPEYIQGKVDDRVAGSAFGAEPLPGEGKLANVWEALKTSGISDDQMKWLQDHGVTDNIASKFAVGVASGALSLNNAFTEAIRGTPLEGLALAFPLGGMETGGAVTLGRMSREPRPDWTPEDGLTGTVTDETPTNTLAQRNPDLGETGAINKDWNEAPAEATRFSTDDVEKMLRPPEPAPTRVPETFDKVENHTRVYETVKTATQDWKNSPGLKVVNSEDLSPDILADLPDDVMGVYDKNGNVNILADRISPEEAKSVVFHEALGHSGLKNLFQEKLDAELDRLYKGNAKLREEADAYSASYGGDVPLGRATEEALAMRSENGVIDSKTLDRLRQMIKTFARRMGITLDVTDAEVSRILGMAHRTVTEGKGVGGSDGIRYMRRPQTTVSMPGTFKDELPHPENDGQLWKYGEAIPRSELDLYEHIQKPYPDYKTDPEGYAKFEAEASRIDAAYKRDEAERLRRDGFKPNLVEDTSDKYMRRRKDGLINQQDVNTVTNRAEKNQQKTGKANNLNLDRITSKLDIKPLQAEIAKTFPKEAKAHDVTRAKAAEKFVTPEDVKDLRNTLEGVEVRALQARQEAVRAGNRRARLANRIAEQKAAGQVDSNLINEYSKALVRENAVIEDTSHIASAAGRLLNQYNILAKGSDIPEHMRFMTRQKDLFDFIDKTGLDDAAKLDVKVDLTRLIEGEKLTKEEITSLKRVFPLRKIREMQDGRSFKQKASDAAANALNLPRSLMSSMDLSAPFRQGLFLVNRKEFWNAFGKMFHYLGSEKAYQALRTDIESRPTYDLMRRSGLDFTDVGTKLTKREEQFMSQWAEKIPVLGKGVKMSERAFVGFLNKLRADVFDDLVRKSENAGVDLYPGEKPLEDIASFVNNATGRGDLGSLRGAGPLLNGLFFSPRLIASRVNLLRPDYYVKLSPVVRKEALKSLVSLGGIAATVTGLASMAGLEVEDDPRSSDFAKIKDGNSRYDILGGFGQYLTLGARLATNEKKTAKGDIQTLGAKFGSDNRLDILENFFENKTSPIASYVAEYLRGKNPVGEPFDPVTSTAERFVPLIIQDLKDLVEDEGWENAWKATPSVFGVGVSTYDADKPREKKEPKWEYVN